MNERIEAPIYSKIAQDMARRIYRGEFREGDRIHGRSTLAGEYNVSPETIRRAMSLLEDMEIIKVNHGSGIYVKSRDNAGKYIDSFKNKEYISELKTEIKSLVEEKQQIEKRINETMNSIIDYADRLKNTNPIIPIEIEIPDECRLLGKTVTETKFWQNTSATIVGIRREGCLILSPGPYAAFNKGDVLLVIGDSGVVNRVVNFINDK